MSKEINVSRRKLFKAAGGIGAVAAISSLSNVAANAQSESDLVLDVCINGSNFVFQGPTHSDGSPAFGATFVVDGVIYPENTLEERGQTAGLFMDGSPQFPNLVLGKWLCYGTFVSDGAHTAEGQPDVVTTQIFDFDPENPGQSTLITHGYEVVGFNSPFKRALQGGTGIYSAFRGQMLQTILALNSTGAGNVRFEI